MTDRLLGIKEASSRLGVSPASTRRLIRASRLQGTKILRRTLVRESEVSRLIRQGTSIDEGRSAKSVKRLRSES